MSLCAVTQRTLSDSIARAGCWSCLAGAALGALGLLGQSLAIEALTTFVPGQAPMVPNTAVALLLVGGAGALRMRADAGTARRLSSVLAAIIVLVIGVATLAEYAFEIDLQVDQLIIASEAGAYPGRPSPPTALSLALLAAALLSFDSRLDARARPSEWLALSGGLIALAAFTGFILGAGPLYFTRRAPLISVAVPTSLSLLFTSAGLLLGRPTAGMLRFAAPGPGGVLLRRLVLPAIVVPVLLGVVVQHLSALVGNADQALALALLASLTTLVLLVLLIITALPLDQTHEELEETRMRVQNLFELAPDGVFVAGREGRYTDVNDAGCRLLGYSRDELIGKTNTDLMPPEDLPRLAHAKSLLLRGEKDVGEWRLRRKDGSYVPVEVSSRILPDGRWQALVRDISERKRLERELQSSHADLARAQTVGNIGSWRLDVTYDELLRSDEESRILGVSPGMPMTHEAFFARVHPDDREYVAREWSSALHGKPYDIEHRICVGDEIKWVRQKADLEFDERGVLVGGVGITQDITERKRLEEEQSGARELIRESRERFELALAGAGLAAWDWNIATGDVIFNPRWAEMRGFRLEEVRAHVDSWISGVHPEDRARVQEALAAHFKGLTPEYQCECRVRTRTGEWLWISDLGKVFARDEGGAPIRMVGVELDITERRRLEDELRLAEAKSSGILSVSAEAIISIDENQRIMLFNEGAENIFGYSKTEAVGAPLDMLIPERHRAAHHRHVAGFAAGSEGSRRMGARGVAIAGLRKSGEEFPADAGITKLAVGETLVLTVELRDVTVQKRLEDEQRFLVDLGTASASTIDYAATAACIARLMARDQADVCIVDTVNGPAELQQFAVAHREPGKAELARELERIQLDRRLPYLGSSVCETQLPLLMSHVTPDYLESNAQNDAYRRVLLQLEPKSFVALPLAAGGRALGCIVAIRGAAAPAYTRSDLPFLKQVAHRAALALEKARLYELAQRAIQSRDDVLGIVAHDLRNPLGTILMQVTVMRSRRTQLEGPSRKPADVIERAAQRMNRLIQDLLDVTSMEAGSLSMERQRVSTRPALLEAARAEEGLVASASLELRLDLAQDLPDVSVDRDRLQQVFENLIGNAIKFTPSGGRITLGAAPGEHEVLFRVSDTGPGIAAVDLPRVFDRFWQAQKAGRHGAGLGLPIVKGIVEAHGGRVWVESSPGLGTTFYFTIPTAAGSSS
jgi:PAS domain S-box-containing protein